MNAAIGGIHEDTFLAIEKWARLSYEKGAIGDIRFFHLLEEAREVASKFLGIAKEEVAFSGSTSLNMNLFAQMLREAGVKKIIAPAVEFPSSTLPWFHHGFEVELVEPREGRIWEEDLISKGTGLGSAIVVSGIQFLTGQKLNLEFLSTELHKSRSHFIINGTQHVGHFDLDLSKLKYTAFTASLHKWLGADLGVSLISMPKEKRDQMKVPVAGWTAVEDPWRLANEPPRILSDMGAFQLGTVPFSSIAGAKAAMEVQTEIGKENISNKVLELSGKLSSIILDKGFEILSPRDQENDRTGICTFKYDGDLDKALAVLEEHKVFVNGRRGSIRASVHYYNNEQDLELFKNGLSLI